MTQKPLSGQGVVRRYALRKEECVLSIGEFEGLHLAWEAHVRRWDHLPDGLALTMMRQALGGAALHLTNRPKSEDVAWTINIVRPPINVFAASDGQEGWVIGRVFTEGVATTDESRLFVETRRARRNPVQSVIDVQGIDILVILEQYYARSEQNPARFFELDDHRYAMIHALPDAREEWLESLVREDVPDLMAREPRQIDERLITLNCGCTSERMLEVVRASFADRGDQLFLGDAEIEVSCPRCGRRWMIDRPTFEGESDVEDPGT
jgi:molecular chaperone Hsp33